MIKRILITTSSFGAGSPSATGLLEKAGLVVEGNPHKRTLTEKEVLDLLIQHRPAGMIAGLEPLTASVLEQSASFLRVISRCGVGLDNVDLEAAKARNIAVCSTPDGPSSAVAELTLGLMLGLLRNITVSDRAVRAGEWKKPLGYLIEELTIGVIGLGRIGKRVAHLCRSFGGKVLGSDIAPNLDWAAQNQVALVKREDLLASADVVTLHLPYATGELHHFIDAEHLRKMKRGAYLINTSRGGLIDEAALGEALKRGHLAGAAIDTFEREPYDGPLRAAGSVILTPHVGSYARAARIRMEQEAAVNVIVALRKARVLDGASSEMERTS